MIAKIVYLNNKEAIGIDEQGKQIALKALVATKSAGLKVGDNVELKDCVHNVWTISKVLPRKNALARPNISNLDQVFITVSVEPQIDFLVLDQILVNCEMNNVDAILVLNKSDLFDNEFVDDLTSQYGQCVKRIITTNALSGENLDELQPLMQGKTSAFIGQSAVGKSTILNFFELGKEQKTDTLTLKAGKKRERGRNTTKASKLFVLPNGGYIADSPGFSKIDLSLIRPQELVFYFPDLSKYRSCKYSNCTHISEGADCGIITAFEEGKINAKRYDRFIKLQKKLIERWNKRYD